jgi:hypothetical protein
VAKWTDVSRILRAEKTAKRVPRQRVWKVKDKLVAWERPLRKSDLEALGDSAPTGAILGVYVPLELKDALLASDKKPYFTTPHFDGYPAILVKLGTISVRELTSLLATACAERATTAKRARRARG